MTTPVTPTPAAPPATAGAPAGHDAAMAARFDAAQTSATTGTPVEPPAAPPAAAPAQFKSMEELQAAYDALKAGTAPKPPEPPKDGKDALTVPPVAPESAEDAAKALADKGLDFAAFQKSYNENGTVTEADYAALAKAGIPKELVDSYVEGQTAKANVIRDSIFKDVGGQDKYGELVQWAATGLSKAEQAAYNDLVSSGDIAKVQMAVLGLQAKHTAAVGSQPNLLTGKTGATVGDVYEDLHQMKKDIASPEYRTSPAFRAKVQAKLERSNIL